ncbi:hypothetical protein K0504_06270 [Neiella marina]|uniref:Uncharacterized protein n=1 Tax=Neiella holothuriorum TaxID=2870530 RepID=A0ABS7EE73_9GAMM|nr:hypothetical protein [Neiella holothuriorum]MBW8190638.1 hypothetical protein [Neiella holothuriorum]
MSTSADANEPVPAVLDESAGNKQALESAASQLLFDRKLSLSPLAFTTSSRVPIEKKQARDAQGKLLNGRELQSEVIVFSLWQQDGECWLQRDDTDQRILLTDVACKPE